jgi:very-short-patch-repair endonuclease
MPVDKKILKANARKLRNNSTPGEIKLWKEGLRAKQMKGYQFNRQYVIDNFIVDFVCRKLKLVIELDGVYHESIKEKDAARDKKLKKHGFTVLRIAEKDVRNDLNNVIRNIEIMIEKLESETDQSPWPHSPRGKIAQIQKQQL